LLGILKNADLSTNLNKVKLLAETQSL